MMPVFLVGDLEKVPRVGEVIEGVKDQVQLVTGLQVFLDIPLLVRNEGLTDLAFKSWGLIWGLRRFRSRSIVEVVVPL